jgi:hypothetical protein
MHRKLRVFLCHSSVDKPIVRDLYKRLRAESWIDPWLDEEKLLPGQDWNFEIAKAVEAADAVIVCLSNNSVTKEGYIQKEVRKVLDISAEKPDETIFVIPLRLDECQPPRRLASWHYVDYFPKEQQNVSFQRLIQSLKIRRERQKVSAQKTNLTKEGKTQVLIPSIHSKDFHSAPLLQEVDRASVSGINFIVAKLRWNKEDVGYSLHAEPNTFTTAGMQTTDFLAYLGFRRERCSFVTRRECYTAWVDPAINISEFAQKFNEAFGIFEKAISTLGSCGFVLDQPEGWGYFYNKASKGRSSDLIYGHGGDGHTSSQSKMLNESEDDYFYYKLSWIENNYSKGWTFHYRLKDFSDQYLLSALNFLQLHRHKECPFFGFEECFWMHIVYLATSGEGLDTHAEFVHRAFGATPNNFPLALQMLKQVDGLLSPFGFHLIQA